MIGIFDDSVCYLLALIWRIKGGVLGLLFLVSSIFFFACKARHSGLVGESD